ncbi:hypothetical protein Tco_0808342 [Tanacetum coccineum]
MYDTGSLGRQHRRQRNDYDHDYYKHEAQYRRDIEADRDSNCIELYFYLKGGKHSAGPISALTLGSSNIIQSSNNYATQLASSAGASEFDETYNSTPGPRFLDGSPVVLTNSNGASRSSLTERIDEINSSPELDEALKRIQKQLSLEHVKDNGTFYNENEYPDDLGFTYNEQNYSGFEEFQYGSDNSVSLQYPGLSPFCVARGSLIIHQRLNLISIIIVLDIAQDQLNTSRNGATDFERLHQYQQTLKDDSIVSSQQNYIWKDVLTYDGDAAYDGSLQNYMYPSDTNVDIVLKPKKVWQYPYMIEAKGAHSAGHVTVEEDSSNQQHSGSL